MWNRFVVWITNYSLSHSRLSLEQRNNIVTHILDSLRALPISSIIMVKDGEMMLNGRSLDFDKIAQLKESASVALDNQALKIVLNEVLYTAVVGGLHKAVISEDLYFYRAAIWFGQKLEDQLKILAQRQE